MTQIVFLDSKSCFCLWFNSMCFKSDWGIPVFCQHLIIAVFYIHGRSLVLSAPCILEHDGLTVQSSRSSPFMLTLTGRPCPLADFIHWQCFIIKATLVLETYVKLFILIFFLAWQLLPCPLLCQQACYDFILQQLGGSKGTKYNQMTGTVQLLNRKDNFCTS